MKENEEHRLSMAMENYLLSIFRLEEQKIKVTAAQLSEHFKSLPTAERLGTSLPSVSAMIRRMAREKLTFTTGFLQNIQPLAVISMMDWNFILIII